MAYSMSCMLTTFVTFSNKFSHPSLTNSHDTLKVVTYLYSKIKAIVCTNSVALKLRLALYTGIV